MDIARVAVVRAGGSVRGSGYVLGRRLVLTAAHVFGSREQVSVQVPGPAGRVTCEVAWWRFDEGPRGWDAALLVAQEDLSDGPLPPVRWGRLVTLEACPAKAVGYPVVGQAGTDTVSITTSSGQVLPESGRDRDRYVLVGSSAEPHGDASPWDGMSGAALWCGSKPGTVPLLTGVVVGDPPGWNHARLEALPAYVLASEPDVRELVREHTGRPMLLEPADLQHLADRAHVPRTPRSPADLLRPEQATVSFMGREDMLEQLTRWCEPPTARTPPDPGSGPVGQWAWEHSPVQAHLLTGAGGAGKTRLASELAVRMATRGWTTVRLTPDTTVPLDALSNVRKPLLIVVDYAETRVPQLHALLEAVDHDQVTSPVRVLALARAAGDWWVRATEYPHSQALATAGVTPVPALHHTREDRVHAYRQALRDFSIGLRLISPATDWATLLPSLTAAEAIPSLTDEDFDTPLSVQMAALLALLDATGRPRAPSASATLEGRLLGHERKYWDATADSPERGLRGGRSGTEIRALAVALACLVPVADRDQARAQLAQLPGLADESAAAVRGALATWLADLYPAPAGSGWGSLQPDRVAEYHIGTQVSRERALFTRILTTLDDNQAAQALTILARAGQHPPHREVIGDVLRDAVSSAPAELATAALTTATRTPHPELLINALAHLSRTTEDVVLLHHLSNQLPANTLALSEWAADLTTRLVEHHDMSEPDLPLLAASLNNQAACLAALGRHEEALVAGSRAVRIRVDLAEQQPALLPDLASSLINQSNCLAELGRTEEALSAVTRAIDIYQVLAERSPVAFLHPLANALNNRASCLAELGRKEEALSAITRAIEIREELAEQRPHAFLPRLAQSLTNQSAHLADLGRYEEALVASSRAVGIYRTLADKRPDAFLPDLASSLNNQSNCLAQLGRGDEALDAVTHAVHIRERLAEQQPRTFLPDLASSLHNQAVCLADLRHHEEALSAIDRAVHIREKLAGQRPQVFLPDLALSLVTQCACLTASGRAEDALTAITRAVGILQTVAEQRPESFLPHLADSLISQSARLVALGRKEDALTAVTRAVHIREDLAARQPDEFLPDLAASLLNQFGRLGILGRREEALSVSTRAVSLYERLVEQRGDAFLPQFAKSLDNLFACYSELGPREKALTTVTRAVETYRVLAEQQPDTYLPSLASSLNRQSRYLQLTRRVSESLTASAEAADIFRTLSERHPETYLTALVDSLLGHISGQMMSGRKEEAVAALTRAIDACRELSELRPDASGAIRYRILVLERIRRDVQNYYPPAW